ncbi:MULTISPECIES: hypothetical protein [Chryseobacterium]|uniref:DUF1648 domain-containing protein n=1 Tax=Chryseobacterium geocarposphaerae TaxID=1416776 RepID=A0ABU1LIB9_9FLAO|nr:MULTISPECIES: hypothetical protein [Chryseobacterium]ALR32378.1 hypothetical protein ATE47_18485 [Chryseobacterium sp. IHB B 17019]MDR6406290.1 hypothetical protein [Chryseobacterium geocarposphaerae]MDR6699689.1 hypothetical protein [Chryseobacterium ginsenosidimutans]
MIPKSIKILFAVPFVIIIGYSVYLFNKFDSIPDIIPIHGYGKNADGFGSKMFLFFPIVLNLVILLIIWLCLRKPENFKFPFEVKEEDKAKTYYTMQLVLVIIAIFATIITTPLLFSDVVYK